MDGGGGDREMFLRSCDCVKSSHIFCSSSRSTASHNPTAAAAAVQKTAQKTAPSRSPSYSQSSKNQINQRPPLEVSLSLAPGKITHSLASGWLAASQLWLSQSLNPSRAPPQRHFSDRDCDAFQLRSSGRWAPCGPAAAGSVRLHGTSLCARGSCMDSLVLVSRMERLPTVRESC